MAARAKPRRLFEAPHDPEALEPGTVVCLKSGSDPMTVVSLTDRDGVMFAELVHRSRPGNYSRLYETVTLPVAVLRGHEEADEDEPPL